MQSPPKSRQRLTLRRQRSLLIKPRSSKSRRTSRKLPKRRSILSTTKTPREAAAAAVATRKKMTRRKMTRISPLLKMANSPRSTDPLAAAAKSAKRTPSIKS